MFRNNKKIFSFSLTLLASLPLTIHAQPADQHVVVAPQCLIKQFNGEYKTLAVTQALALITVSDQGIDQLNEARHQQKKPCGGFMDVTHEWNKTNLQKTSPAAFLNRYEKPAASLVSTKTNYTIKYPAHVNQLLKQINPEDMRADLTTLTAFPDRYSKSDNGVKAANWIKSQVEIMAKNNNRTDVSYTFINTGDSYKQPSLVIKIGDSNEPGVVVGGHMDTLSSTWSNKPGADDDGTGTVTVLETARVLLGSGMHFKKPIYLIWYAAEEMGLVGSQHVVADFKAKKIPVSAVMQLDMTGYSYKNDPTMWLVNDNVNKDLTAYLETLINTYVKQPVKYTQCGYDCSDHASWHLGGYPASIPFEAAFETYNPNIHTSADTMEKLSLKHMESFSKVAVAFAVELAEPVA